MKKTNKVYSASDFQGLNVTMAVEDCYWAIDTIHPTKTGDSGKPLFEVGLKMIRQGQNTNVPDGWVDGTALMSRNRTYYVREKRPLYTKLLEIWETLGDDPVFMQACKQELGTTAFMGHVERLSGVKYTKSGNNKTVISCSKMELWYPDEFEPGAIVDDFIYLCNIGVYKPIIEEKKEESIDLTKIDPNVIAAIKAMMK